MRRTSRGGWLSRLAAKRQKSWVWHPDFEPQNRKPGKSAPVAPCECRAEHGAPICRVYCATRGRARILLPVVCRHKAPPKPCALPTASGFSELSLVSRVLECSNVTCAGAWARGRAKNHETRQSAPAVPCRTPPEHGAAICGALRLLRPRSNFTSAGDPTGLCFLFCFLLLLFIDPPLTPVPMPPAGVSAASTPSQFASRRTGGGSPRRP